MAGHDRCTLAHQIRLSTAFVPAPGPMAQSSAVLHKQADSCGWRLILFAEDDSSSLADAIDCRLADARLQGTINRSGQLSSAAIV